MEKLKQTGKVINLHKDNEKKSDVHEEIMARMNDQTDSKDVIDKETGLTKQDILDFYEKGDFSLGNFVRRRIAGSYCYNRNNERWFILDKETGIWTFDEQDLHQKTVHAELWQALGAALRESDSFHKDFRKQFRSVISNLLGRINKTKGTKDIARIATQFTDDVGVNAKVFDADVRYIGAQNGIVDLQERKLIPPAPEKYITKMANANFNPEAGKPVEFLEFLKEVFKYPVPKPDLPDFPDEPTPLNDTDFVFGDEEKNKTQYEQKVADVEAERQKILQEWEEKCEQQRDELIHYLQKLFGYVLTGTNKEHLFVIFLGPRGRNGKGVLVRTMNAVLGDYGDEISTELLVSSSKNKNSSAPAPDLMDLKGKRMVTASETNQADRFDTGVVKKLTGGDKIPGRNLQESEITRIDPTHTIFLQTNYAPNAPAEDQAFWERVRTISFPRTFIHNPEPNNHLQALIDKDLEDKKIAAEYDAIFMWILEGTQLYYKEGLTAPECVNLAVSAYRQSGDFLDEFIKECCDQNPKSRLKVSKFTRALSEWMVDQSMKNKVNSQVLKDRLSRRNYEIKPYNGYPCVRGLELNFEGLKYLGRHEDKHDRKK